MERSEKWIDLNWHVPSRTGISWHITCTYAASGYFMVLLWLDTRPIEISRVNDIKQIIGSQSPSEEVQRIPIPHSTNTPLQRREEKEKDGRHGSERERWVKGTRYSGEKYKKPVSTRSPCKHAFIYLFFFFSFYFLPLVFLNPQAPLLHPGMFFFFFLISGISSNSFNFFLTYTRLALKRNKNHSS